MKRFWSALRDTRARAFAILSAAVAIAATAGVIFQDMHEPEPIISGPGVTKRAMLGDFVPSIAGTAADTPVFVLEGREPGGTLLLFGGTHPQEISGLLAAVVVVENARVTHGRVLVVPQANRSGFTYTEPLEGFPHTFEIETLAGRRWFRNGMRLANPVHQWPDPDLYVHYPSGEPMVGLESRNLNRNYPGRANGRFTERLGHALMMLAREQQADVVFDLHEAYPEYPIINMIVAHQRAFEIATLAALMLQSQGIKMDVMASPASLRGLSHREFGDHTAAYALLSETANPAMGRFRGRTDERLVVDGRDVNYVRAAELKRLFVHFDAMGHPLHVRVARQLAGVLEVLNAFNEEKPDRKIVIEGIPEYESLIKQGLGSFLLAPR
jgi:predicted deacylase